MHHTQQTDAVKTLLGRKKTVLVNIGGGLTSYLPFVDVIVNVPFNMSVKHIERNLELYTQKGN